MPEDAVSPRLAASPPNALLNFLYGILESEARLSAAARVVLQNWNGRYLNPRLQVLMTPEMSTLSIEI